MFLLFPLRTAVNVWCIFIITSCFFMATIQTIIVVKLFTVIFVGETNIELLIFFSITFNQNKVDVGTFF